MPPTLLAYDIGCEPSPSVPAEMVIQDGWSTYLLFFAVSKSTYQDLGVAIVECQGCSSVKFGYPNDEGLPEHPLYALGLGTAKSAVLEVVGSTWAKEIHQQKLASKKRIWGRRDATYKSIQSEPMRHFIIPMKEKTFECIATGLTVGFANNFSDAVEYVHRKLSEH